MSWQTKKKKKGSAIESKSRSKLDHKPEALHDPIAAFLRKHDGFGLTSVIRRQSSYCSCAWVEAACTLKGTGKAVWVEICASCLVWPFVKLTEIFCTKRAKPSLRLFSIGSPLAPPRTPSLSV